MSKVCFYFEKTLNERLRNVSLSQNMCLTLFSLTFFFVEIDEGITQAFKIILTWSQTINRCRPLILGTLYHCDGHRYHLSPKLVEINSHWTQTTLSLFSVRLSRKRPLFDGYEKGPPPYAKKCLVTQLDTYQGDKSNKATQHARLK